MWFATTGKFTNMSSCDLHFFSSDLAFKSLAGQILRGTNVLQAKGDFMIAISHLIGDEGGLCLVIEQHFNLVLQKKASCTCSLTTDVRGLNE